MKGNKMLYAGIAVLVLGIGFAIGTYAYYQTTLTGTATGTVLYWNCQSSINPVTVQMPNLYPGDSGSFTITVTSTITSTYTITFSGLTNIGTGSSHPNLNLYKEVAHTNVINNSSTVTGTITSNGGSGTSTIYWYWPYGTTAETYSTAVPSLTYTVVCRQT